MKSCPLIWAYPLPQDNDSFPHLFLDFWAVPPSHLLPTAPGASASSVSTFYNYLSLYCVPVTDPSAGILTVSKQPALTYILVLLSLPWASARDRVQSLDQEDPLEKEIATHSSILA